MRENSFVSPEYFFNRVEDLEGTRPIFAKSSIRSKNYPELAELRWRKAEEKKLSNTRPNAKQRLYNEHPVGYPIG